MSSITLWGQDRLLGGENEDEEVRVQVAAMKCGRPHILILRWEDKVFVFDQFRFREAEMSLPKKVKLDRIMAELAAENEKLPFSPGDALDTRHRVERVIKILANEHHELP